MTGFLLLSKFYFLMCSLTFTANRSSQLTGESGRGLGKLVWSRGSMFCGRGSSFQSRAICFPFHEYSLLGERLFWYRSLPKRWQSHAAFVTWHRKVVSKEHLPLPCLSELNVHVPILPLLKNFGANSLSQTRSVELRGSSAGKIQFNLGSDFRVGRSS